MPKQQISLKQLAIDKDNTSILIAVGIASFLVIFSLIASNALIKQLRYKSKVSGMMEVALKQLNSIADGG